MKNDLGALSSNVRRLYKPRYLSGRVSIIYEKAYNPRLNFKIANFVKRKTYVFKILRSARNI